VVRRLPDAAPGVARDQGRCAKTGRDRTSWGSTRSSTCSSVANDPCGDLDPKLTWEIAAGDHATGRPGSPPGRQAILYASSGSVYGVKDEPRGDRGFRAAADLGIQQDQDVRRTTCCRTRTTWWCRSCGRRRCADFLAAHAPGRLGQYAAMQALTAGRSPFSVATRPGRTSIPNDIPTLCVSARPSEHIGVFNRRVREHFDSRSIARKVLKHVP